MMNELPFISVVIPARNEGKYLARCLDAVSALDYPADRMDVCVVDNGSTDDTREQVAAYPNVRVLEQEGQIGAVRNHGGKNSTGELIAFLDADCVPATDWLRRAVVTLSETRASVVSAVLRAENNKCPWIEKYWLAYLRSKTTDGVNDVKTIYSFCFVVRRDAMDAVGWFNEQLVTCEDSDLGYRISQSGHSLVVDTSIETVHLRNAKTIKQFFRRHMWHGGSNLQNFFGHKFELAELPSLLLPIGYVLLLVCVAGTALAGMPLVFGVGLAAALVVPVAIALSRRVGSKASLIPGYAFIWFLYLTARGIGQCLKIGSPWK